ncbi:hypothetical protein IVA93_37555 (plasmid) [Bradyrhizobium sp. 155]|uniref:hypothetical protein n=1 Tax=unclassified Bradyrhizobium TaxID=2631580 RepID=UPI001FFE62D8|nr:MULTISPECIES: hypothetical protein [unclassified Bradyrhizobium]UPK15816.1 hypothetical protein IVA93_37555 [Bradyrhizobium sp. 155]UPK23445.1 hypothetical protein IVA73_38245 [Bradyrhizobium sp. 131]
MTSKAKRTISVSPESDYEIHRLANLWGVTVTRTRERCYHYAATGRIGEIAEIKRASSIRQAEAKVEMLKAER